LISLLFKFHYGQVTFFLTVLLSHQDKCHNQFTDSLIFFKPQQSSFCSIQAQKAEKITYTGGMSSGTFSFKPPFFLGVRPLKRYIQHKKENRKWIPKLKNQYSVKANILLAYLP